MQVLVHGRQMSLNAANTAGFAAVANRGEFFRRSDVATLHLRLVDFTRACVISDDLARMKPTVNTSRAELIAPGALTHALRGGRPDLAAVDVFEKEPVDSSEPLLAPPKAICTPHLGFTECSSYERFLGSAFANLVDFARGRPTNVANPEVLTAARSAAAEAT